MNTNDPLQPDLQPGDLALHDLGLKVKVIGPPRVETQAPRLLCQVLNPGHTGLAQGQQASFRVNRLTPL